MVSNDFDGFFMIKGLNITLRACEPYDLDVLYEWENDTSVWHVTNTYIPFSKHTLKQYVDSIQDIYTDKQLRLIIERDGKPVGMIDLFDFEPYHLRAGIGILVAHKQDRNTGIATEALQLLKTYCKNHLNMHLLFCHILHNNTASIKLFEKCGFEKQGEKKMWHRSANGFIDEWYYQLIL